MNTYFPYYYVLLSPQPPFLRSLAVIPLQTIIKTMVPFEPSS